MNYANIKTCDSADGEGVRVALYVSGCRFHCKGCHNEVAWDYKYGDIFDKNVLEYIKINLNHEYIQGFSILGGEPLDPENRSTVFNIIKEIYSDLLPEQNIWLWTAYIWEDIIKNNMIPHDILSKIKVIVDGPFDIDIKNIGLKFRGSSNQRVIDVQKSLSENKTILYLK